MSNTERWVVYPLLLLSLGMGMRGAFIRNNDLKTAHIQAEDLQVQKLRCDELVVGPSDKAAHVRIGQAVEVTADGHNIPHPAGIVEVFGNGKPLAVLAGIDYGELELNGATPDARIILNPKLRTILDALSHKINHDEPPHREELVSPKPPAENKDEPSHREESVSPKPPAENKNAPDKSSGAK